MMSRHEIAAAEARMNAAKDELLSYVEQRKALDSSEYRRLITNVKRTEAEFLRAISTLGA